MSSEKLDECRCVFVGAKPFCGHCGKPYPIARPSLSEAEARAEQEFLDASVAVWREIDRLSALPDSYPGLPQSNDLRRRERAAWEQYRAVLDSKGQVVNGGDDE